MSHLAPWIGKVRKNKNTIVLSFLRTQDSKTMNLGTHGLETETRVSNDCEYIQRTHEKSESRTACLLG